MEQEKAVPEAGTDGLLVISPDGSDLAGGLVQRGLPPLQVLTACIVLRRVVRAENALPQRPPYHLVEPKGSLGRARWGQRWVHRGPWGEKKDFFQSCS